MPSSVVRSLATVAGLVMLTFGSLPMESQQPGPSMPAIEPAQHGVYLRLASGVPGSFDRIVARVRAAAIGDSMQLLADYELAVDREDCDFRAHLFVISEPGRNDALIPLGHTTPFALPLRLAVFQDENGNHISMANPLSLDRTIVDQPTVAGQSRALISHTQQMLQPEFAEWMDGTEYGQIRDEALIGKTMGIIAGGPFEEQLETIAKVKVSGPGELESVANRLYRRLEAVGDSRKWKIRPVYRLDLLDRGMVLIGLSGGPVEERAFQIVAAGGDDSRDGMACPGIDHAPAFPIELLLVAVEDRVEVRLIDEMFRMKMYFEDAGKMKFAANMRMPGSIENEIRDKVEESLY